MSDRRLPPTVPDRWIVTFTDAERAAMQAAVSRASENKEATRVAVNPVNAHSDKSQILRDWIALRGEYAIAKSFGLGIEMCDTTRLGLTGDDGRDLILPDGTSVQAKAILRKVEYTPLPFLFALNHALPDEFVADVGVLVYILPDRSRCEIAGWISRESFFARARRRNLGSGTRLTVTTGDLRPFSELHATVMARVA